MGKQKILKAASDASSFDDAVFNMDKFLGEGVMFKCKLFGSLKVEAARGDTICATAINRLKQQAKQLNKERKIHKQRIFLNISLKGIRIIDEKTRKLEHAHIVHKISYISHDKDDRRTFAYIVSLPHGYTLFAFRTEKNAGNVTASLKELFHVIYLKHKHDREKGVESKNDDQPNFEDQPTEGIEESEEEIEDPYSVPVRFQLKEESEDEEHYSTPVVGRRPDVSDNSQETSGANLLDWTDVNEELEFMNTGMKRSDTKQLLAELGDLNMDANPPQLSEPQAAFSNDPFFSDSSAFSPSDFDQGGMKPSLSDPNLQQKANPFMQTPSDHLSPQSAATSNLSATKSKSMDNGLFNSNDLFSTSSSSSYANPQQGNNPSLLSEVGDLFSSVPTSQPWSSSSSSSHQMPTVSSGGVWGTSNPSNSGVFDAFSDNQASLSPSTNSDSLFASLGAEPTGLMPEKMSEKEQAGNDPFAALAGGIHSMKEGLPTADVESVAKFQKKTQPAPSKTSQMPITQGPTVHPSQLKSQQMQQQNNFQNQTNPFSQPQPAYNAGFPGQNAPRPEIPPRVDLMSTQNSNYQTPSPFMQNSPAPQMPYMQTNATPFQMQGNAMQSDPFSGLGNAFSLSSTTQAGPAEPLYATVNKPKHVNGSHAANQPQDDMFAMFDNKSTTATAFTATNTNTGMQSNQDPFGDLGAF
eukprot:gene7967-8825_t